MSIVAKRLDGSRCHFVQQVDLGPGHIVLDGFQLPPRNGDRSPLFSTHVYNCGQGRRCAVALLIYFRTPSFVYIGMSDNTKFMDVVI